jgi:hypothetical protein
MTVVSIHGNSVKFPFKINFKEKLWGNEATLTKNIMKTVQTTRRHVDMTKITMWYMLIWETEKRATWLKFGECNLAQLLYFWGWNWCPERVRGRLSSHSLSVRTKVRKRPILPAHTLSATWRNFAFIVTFLPRYKQTPGAVGFFSECDCFSGDAHPVSECLLPASWPHGIEEKFAGINDSGTSGQVLTLQNFPHTTPGGHKA